MKAIKNFALSSLRNPKRDHDGTKKSINRKLILSMCLVKIKNTSYCLESK